MNPIEALRIFWPNGIPPADFEKALVLASLAPKEEVAAAVVAAPPAPVVQAISAPPPPTERPKPAPRPAPAPIQAPIPPKPLPNKTEGRSGTTAQAVLEYVTNAGAGGTTSYEISDQLELSNSTTHHHLMKFVADGLVRRRLPPNSQQWVYTLDALDTPAADPQPPSRTTRWVKGELEAKVREVVSTGPCTSGEVAATLNVTPQHARTVLERLTQKKEFTRGRNVNGHVNYSLRVRKERARPGGGPSQRSRVLAMLEEEGELTVAAIREKLGGASQNGVSAILSLLKSENLITARQNPDSPSTKLYARLKPNLPHVPHMNGATAQA